MHLFYAPDIDFSADFLLSEEESRHTVKVLRLVKGAEVCLTDGKGNIAVARLIEVSPKACTLKVLSVKKESGKRNFSLHLAISPTKNIDRIEWLFEKITEIGIEKITPLITKRSERKEVNLPRLERILISAMKQSMRAYLPELAAPVSLEKLLDNAAEKRRFIAHCLPGTRDFKQLEFDRGDSILVLVGPEGDFTPEEISLSISKGFSPLNLGASRLRTETAGLVVCSQLAYIMSQQHDEPTA